jgi:hypothetical protein
MSIDVFDSKCSYGNEFFPPRINTRGVTLKLNIIGKIESSGLSRGMTPVMVAFSLNATNVSYTGGVPFECYRYSVYWWHSI